MKKKHKILFVCLGNICRSPAAQAVMQRLADEAGRTADFELDSAGISAFHEGEPADARMRRHAARRGLHITHLSRPVREADFHRFDLILGMDDANMDNLRRRSPDPACAAKLRRMADYCRRLQADYVPDPYYGGADGFEHVLDLLEDACRGLLDSLAD